jgi:hypothetical protein
MLNGSKMLNRIHTYISVTLLSFADGILGGIILFVATNIESGSVKSIELAVIASLLIAIFFTYSGIYPFWRKFSTKGEINGYQKVVWSLI